MVCPNLKFTVYELQAMVFCSSSGCLLNVTLTSAIVVLFGHIKWRRLMRHAQSQQQTFSEVMCGCTLDSTHKIMGKGEMTL